MLCCVVSSQRRKTVRLSTVSHNQHPSLRPPRSVPASRLYQMIERGRLIQFPRLLFIRDPNRICHVSFPVCVWCFLFTPAGGVCCHSYFVCFCYGRLMHRGTDYRIIFNTFCSALLRTLFRILISTELKRSVSRLLARK